MGTQSGAPHRMRGLGQDRRQSEFVPFFSFTGPLSRRLYHLADSALRHEWWSASRDRLRAGVTTWAAPFDAVPVVAGPSRKVSSSTWTGPFLVS